MIEPIKPIAEGYEDPVLLNISDYLIRRTDHYPKPIPILCIKQDGYHIPFMSEDNISILFGPAKARKSGLIKSMCQAILNGSNEKMFSTYQSKKIAVIDTEQSQHDSHDAVKGIYYMTGADIDYYSVLTLTKDQKKQLVEQHLKQNPDCRMLIIDNIVHFVKDFNNVAESGEITQWLLKLKSEYKTHILVVIHENPSGTYNQSLKPRGNLGTNLMNLCETAIRIQKDPDDETRSIVSAALTRGKTFRDFILMMDDQKIPFLMDDHSLQEKKTAKKPNY